MSARCFRLWPVSCLAILLLAGCSESAPPAAKTDAASKPAAPAAAPEAKATETSEATTPDVAADKATTSANGAKPSTLEPALNELIEGVKQNNLEAVWNALPPLYHLKIQQVFRGLGSSMDRPNTKEVFVKVAETLRKIEQVLKTKKDQLLQNPRLEEMGFNREELAKNWDAIVKLYSTVLDSGLTDSEKLKQFDAGAFVKTTGSSVLAQVADLSATMPDDPYKTAVRDQVEKIQFTVLSEDDKAALVRFTTTDNSSEPREVKFVKVQEKWLPEEFHKEFGNIILQAGIFVQSALPVIVQNNREQFTAVLEVANSTLDQLAMTDDPAEFNAILNDSLDQGREFAGNFRILGGPRRPAASATTSVTVIVTGQLSEEQRSAIGKQLISLADDQEKGLVEQHPEEGRIRFEVSPVADVDGFSKKVTFTEVITVDAEKRTIELKAIEVAPSEPSSTPAEPAPAEPATEQPPAEAPKPE